MNKQRMIEILAEEMSKDTQIKIGQPFKLCSYDDALTAMQRAVEEAERDIMSKLPSWNQLQSELTRLRDCETVVRELAETGLVTHYMDHISTARQWVKNNPK